MSKSKTAVPEITDDLKKAVELYLLAKTIHEQVADTISLHVGRITGIGYGSKLVRDVITSFEILALDKQR